MPRTAIDVRRAASEAERDDALALRRELSPALKKISTIKLNNDVVVPRGRIPELFALVNEIQQESGLPIASFGHAGDGNIHVNIMVPDTGTTSESDRAQAARRRSGPAPVRRRRGAGGLDQRGARHRIHEGAVSRASSCRRTRSR